MNNPDEDGGDFEHPPCNTKLYSAVTKVVRLCLSLVNCFIFDLFICFFASCVVTRFAARRAGSVSGLHQETSAFPRATFTSLSITPSSFDLSICIAACSRLCLCPFFFLPFHVWSSFWYSAPVIFPKQSLTPSKRHRYCLPLSFSVIPSLSLLLSFSPSFSRLCPPPFIRPPLTVVCPVYPQQTPTVDVRGVADHGNKL